MPRPSTSTNLSNNMTNYKKKNNNQQQQKENNPYNNKPAAAAATLSTSQIVDALLRVAPEVETADNWVFWEQRVSQTKLALEDNDPTWVAKTKNGERKTLTISNLYSNSKLAVKFASNCYERNDKVHLFKEGIAPHSEDDQCKGGGRFYAVLPGKAEAINAFLLLLVKSLHGGLVPTESLRGLTVTYKGKTEKFTVQLWVQGMDDDLISKTNSLLKRSMKTDWVMYFTHQEKPKRNNFRLPTADEGFYTPTGSPTSSEDSLVGSDYDTPTDITEALQTAFIAASISQAYAQRTQS